MTTPVLKLSMALVALLALLMALWDGTHRKKCTDILVDGLVVQHICPAK